MTRSLTGTVSATDTEAGTCSVAWTDRVRTSDSPYAGLAPWPGDIVSGEMTGPATRRVTGVIGQRSELGPNVFPNPNGAQLGPNLLADPGMESGVGEWTAQANTTRAQTAATAFAGSFSMAITKTVGAGTAEVRSPKLPARPGKGYGFRARARAATTARTVRWVVRFYAADGTTVLDTFTGAGFTDATAVWTNDWDMWQNVPSPPGTVYVEGAIQVLSAALSEVHYIDQVVIGNDLPGIMPSGATAWRFDATTESWFTGPTSTLVWQGSGALSGEGCVVLTRTGAAGNIWAESPIGTGGVAVIAGRSYSAFGFIQPVAFNPERQGFMAIDWFNAAGTAIGTTSGALTTIRNGEWTQLALSNALAPAGAAFAATYFQINSPGAGQAFLLDTAAIVTPPITKIRQQSGGGAYVWPGEDTSIEVRSLSSGIALVQLLEGLNGDSTGAAEVLEGDDWTIQFDYINNALNATFRNMAIAATWYDITGAFIGISLGDTTGITSNPGSGWNHAKETFNVPPGAAYLRGRAIFLTSGNESVYLANIDIHRAESALRRMRPQGAVPPFTHGHGDVTIDYVNPGGDIWRSGNAAFVTYGDGSPISIKFAASGWVQQVSGFDWSVVHLILTPDSWSSYIDGPDSWCQCDAGYQPVDGVGLTLEWTGRPVGEVWIFAQLLTYGFADSRLYAQVSWDITPMGES